MTQNIQNIFSNAVSAYEKKDYAHVKELCLSLLELNPDHAGGLFLLGTAEFALGRVGEAERYMLHALSLNSEFAETHVGLAQVLMAQGKYVDAVTALHRSINIKPNHAYAHSLMGDALCYERRYADAVSAYQKSLDIDPNIPAAWNNLCVALCELGKIDDAIVSGKQAIFLKPDYVAAFNNIGNAYRAAGKWGEAQDFYEKALAFDPKNSEARNNLGLIYLHYRADLTMASRCFEEIILNDEKHFVALTHLGIVHCQQGQFSDGLSYYEKALILSPGYREALNNKANALRALGRSSEAVAVYEHVVAIKPEDPEGHHNLALGLLMEGNFPKGWAEYEWRWKTSQLLPAFRDFVQPQWRGEIGYGKTILLHAEQGFGDTLQFCRYAKIAAERGFRVILEVQTALVRLMQTLEGVEEVVARGDALPAFDIHCPLMSIPFAMGPSSSAIPTLPKFLRVLEPNGDTRIPSGQTDFWRVGLAWAGNPRLFAPDLAAANRRRSINPVLLEPILNIKECEFFSLQKDEPYYQGSYSLIDHMPLCKDFADTAKLIDTLDVVIAVDSAVAHLAASINKPVWLLNRYDSCWRWFHSGDATAWYPTMKIFRQTDPGQWDGVINEVVRSLQAQISQGKSQKVA